MIDPGVIAGSITHLRSTSIALSTTAATGRHVGDQITIARGDGTPTTLTLAAIYDRNLGFGDSLTFYPASTPPKPYSTVYLRTVQPASTVSQQLNSYPGVHAVTSTVYRRTRAAGQANANAANIVLLGLIVAFASISAITALHTALHARLADVRVLHRTGATQQHLRRILHTENACIGVLALTLGTLTSLATVTAFDYGMLHNSTNTTTLSIVGAVTATITIGFTLATALSTRAVMSMTIKNTRASTSHD